MTVNVFGPYQAKPSRPRSPDISFTAPGNEDFLFRNSAAPARLVCLPYLRAYDLTWTLSPNCVQAPLRTGHAAVRFDNSFALDLPLNGLAPGFYDVQVTITTGESQRLQASTTLGWQVDNLQVHPVRPADFDAFWATQLTALDAISPAPSVVLERTLRDAEIDAYNLASAAIPANYDPAGSRARTVEIHRVRFTSQGGMTVEGWFTKPVGPGPFPSLLILPGAGNGPRPAPVEHARHGYATLDIQAHGNPVDATNNTRQAEPLALYLNALQAVRALKQLPSVNPDRIAVIGGSQGGRLTLVVAALDPTIKAAIPAIAHFAYVPWSRWTQRLNQEKAHGGDAGFTGERLTPAAPTPDATTSPASLATTSPASATSADAAQFDYYLDPLNFASRITCPVLMNCGLTDPVSPATAIYAAYHAIPGPKQIIPLPNTGHDWSPAFDRHAWHWLAGVL